MRILFVTPELAPTAKAGGLADVSSALTKHLHGAGHDVRTYLPHYAQVTEAGIPVKPVAGAEERALVLGPWTFTYSVQRARWPDGDRPVHLIDCPHLFRRPFLYGEDPDEHLRFALLTRAALEECQRERWAPDIAHGNDWPTALLPVYLRTLYSWDELFAGTRSVLSLHNLAHQGAFPGHAVGDVGLENDAHHLPPDDMAAGVLNMLKAGILHADALVTVSETYAREIQTREGGAGLDRLLFARRDALHGIVNGMDVDEWNPETDTHIPRRYSADDLPGKRVNKDALLDAFELPREPDAPLLGVVSRLTHQKGFDLFFDAMPDLMRRRPVRLVVLGGGEARYAAFFLWLAEAFPGRVGFRQGFDNGLAHLIEAGSDIFLMPSLYEPCGLNQMYSLRYGTIPVVRRTGGLADTVRPYDPASGEGTGFVFEHFTATGFAWALEQALDAFEDRATWTALMRRAMAEDFSWRHQAPRYEALYAALRDGRSA